MRSIIKYLWYKWDIMMNIYYYNLRSNRDDIDRYINIDWNWDIDK